MAVAVVVAVALAVVPSAAGAPGVVVAAALDDPWQVALAAAALDDPRQVSLASEMSGCLPPPLRWRRLRWRALLE